MNLAVLTLALAGAPMQAGLDPKEKAELRKVIHVLPAEIVAPFDIEGQIVFIEYLKIPDSLGRLYKTKQKETVAFLIATMESGRARDARLATAYAYALLR